LSGDPLLLGMSATSQHKNGLPEAYTKIACRSNSGADSLFPR